MKSFVQRFGAWITGILSGFDRLRLRGTKRLLASTRGLYNYLWQRQILLKEPPRKTFARREEVGG